MNREKESIRSLEPYVTNPTVCSVKLDANEGDKDLYRDLLKKTRRKWYYIKLLSRWFIQRA